MDMESWKWLLEIDIKEIGQLERKMEKVLVYFIIGHYVFANGDVYEGEFQSGNR